MTDATMDGPHDLFDQRQVELFDALNRVQSLNLEQDIAVPQIVVVGDQKNGKSSVLEAIGRVRFPVSDELCTRFPIKLILRRGQQRDTKLRIIPASGRTPEERANLEKFGENMIDNRDNVEEIFTKAARVLGLPVKTDHEITRRPLQRHVKQMTDDVLVIHKVGPDLPILDLIDLPGLFRFESADQNEETRILVEKMVDDYIRSPDNLTLLVVNLGASWMSQCGPRAIQTASRIDARLSQRVVGVFTRPGVDKPVDQSLNILLGNGDPLNLTTPWQVVKNQSQEERHESLDLRDEKERQFFAATDAWHSPIPVQQKGINALRLTLGRVFWAHTRARIPKLAEALQARIAEIESKLQGLSSRASDKSRRQYLSSITRTLSEVTREACTGRCSDRDCRLKSIDSKRFFGPVIVATPEDQVKRLRANTRALAGAFANAMRAYGKTTTRSVEDGASTDDGGARTPEAAVNGTGGAVTPVDANPTNVGNFSLPMGKPSDEYPEQRIILEFYTHTKPVACSAEQYDAWLASQIERTRGREPLGEVNDVIYSGVFEYQSAKWLTIAKCHLEAIWTAVNTFLAHALEATCPDELVRRDLQTHLLDQTIQRLHRDCSETLDRIISCHRPGSVGFIDGFAQVRFLEQHNRMLANRLFKLTTRGLAVRVVHAGGITDMSDVLKRLRGSTKSTVYDTLNEGTRNPHLDAVVMEVFEDVVDQVFGHAEAGVINDGPSLGETAHKNHTTSIEPLKHDPVARVQQHTETYYEMSLTAFVGYVNSFVVELGILDRMPQVLSEIDDRILGQRDEETTELVEKIAGESVDSTEKRERYEVELKTLQEVLATVKKCL